LIGCLVSNILPLELDAEDEDDPEEDNKNESKGYDDENEDTKLAATPKVTAYSNRTNGTNGMLTFMPIYAQSVWIDHDKLQKMITLAIVLPSGIINPEDSKVRVADNQHALMVSIKWPPMISKVASLHAYWNNTHDPDKKLPQYHPKILGFHQYFASLKAEENDSLYSEAIIPLPFLVQKDIAELTRLATTEEERIIYVDLRAIQAMAYKCSPDADIDFKVVKLP